MGLKETHGRKMLSTMLKQTDEEEQILKLNIERLSKQLAEKKQKKKEIATKLVPKEVTVSEHALLRYIQHVLKIDLGAIEKPGRTDIKMPQDFRQWRISKCG